jgi:hypothetical protein
VALRGPLSVPLGYYIPWLLDVIQTFTPCTYLPSHTSVELPLLCRCTAAYKVSPSSNKQLSAFVCFLFVLHPSCYFYILRATFTATMNRSQAPSMAPSDKTVVRDLDQRQRAIPISAQPCVTQDPDPFNPLVEDDDVVRSVVSCMLVIYLEQLRPDTVSSLSQVTGYVFQDDVPDETFHPSDDHDTIQANINKAWATNNRVFWWDDSTCYAIQSMADMLSQSRGQMVSKGQKYAKPCLKMKDYVR